MPITIIQPSGGTTGSGPNAVIEVGHLIRAQTDFVGPLSTSAFWTTEVWLNAQPEQFVMRRKYAFESTQLSVFAWAVGINDAARDGEGLGVRPTAVAQSTLRVMLDDPTSAFHEQAQVNVQLTAPFDVGTRAGVSTQGGIAFTAQDQENLAVTRESVQVALPVSTTVGAVLQTGLAQFVQSAPLQLLSRAECRTIVGAGSLTRPSPGFNVNALGFSWDFLVVPSFMGRSLGNPVEYEQRIVQFSIVQRDFAGSERRTQIIDAHSDGQFVTWGLNAPFRIDYSVTPSCEVQFCWLLLLGA